MKSHQQDIAALRCPVTKSPLAWATEQQMAEINGAIASGEVQTRGSRSVTEVLEAGLLNGGQSLLYPVQSGVICLLPAEAVEVAEHWSTDETT
jgi:uncharacterized protein YbaR (Trm112 family)